ncbi:hypothetical protein LMH73_004705 [Vibrio splendidus]|nr:hypothetical protein [Vibrio splendidus]MCC4882529.1 hypothetical protein [Vibrio splendidus]
MNNPLFTNEESFCSFSDKLASLIHSKSNGKNAINKNFLKSCIAEAASGNNINKFISDLRNAETDIPQCSNAFSKPMDSMTVAMLRAKHCGLLEIDYNNDFGRTNYQLIANLAVSHCHDMVLYILLNNFAENLKNTNDIKWSPEFVTLIKEDEYEELHEYPARSYAERMIDKWVQLLSTPLLNSMMEGWNNPSELSNNNLARFIDALRKHEHFGYLKSMIEKVYTEDESDVKLTHEELHKYDFGSIDIADVLLSIMQENMLKIFN